MVVVNSYDMIKEVLVTKGNDFAGRPDGLFRLKYFLFYQTDMTFASPNDATFWSPVRKTVTNNLKLYNSGMERVEGVVIKGTLEMMDLLKDKRGEPFDINEDLFIYAMKMMIYFTTGMEVKNDSECLRKMREMEKLSTETAGMTGEGAILDTFPFLRFLGHPAFRKLTRSRDLMVENWENFKTEHLSHPENPHYSASCMKALSDLRSQLNDNQSSEVMTDTNTMLVICNLWFAGMVTTSTNIYALINILCHHPEVAAKAREEVDRVVGRSHQVSLEDRDELHYCRACIFESLRYCTIVAFGLPHATTKDTQLLGADIPKGTMVLTNVWALHHDPELWDEPWEFRPERFLDDTGHILPADHDVRRHLLVFGAGPRTCLGSVLALNRMLIFTASLLQSFNLEFAEKVTPCDPRSYTPAAILQPERYKMRFVPRD